MAARLPIPVLVALVAGGLVSALGLAVTRHLETAGIEADLQRRAGNAVQELSGELERQSWAMEMLRALWNASEEVTRAEFATFTAPLLTRYSSIVALQWAPRVTQGEREQFERATAAEGVEDFVIRKEGEEGELVPATPRVVHYPVLYAEPLSEEAGVLGFDLGSGPDRLSTLERAMASGEMQASVPLRRLQDPPDETCMMLALPVYRGPELSGFVVGWLRLERIAERLFYRLAGDGLSVALADVTDPGAPLPLHTPRGDHAEDLRAELPLSFGGRAWSAVCSAGPQFAASRRTLLPWLVLASGLGMTVLVALWLGAHERRARDLSAANARLLQQVAATAAAREEARVAAEGREPS
ncbi:MAG: hypothetical protein EYC70_15580 [Planctomycetota bacterium]|nr:MAG: hypothetical protein EYC70_15580 [Planctomycetota bacterium]